MNALELLAEIKRRFGITTNRELARMLGMSEMALGHWRNLSTPLTVRRIANAIKKTREAAIRDAQLGTIRPIVEYFPLDSIETTSGLKFELFPTRGEANPLYRGLRESLSNARGIYVFYDSRGRALYVGKARQQSLWSEMKIAFNRDRSTQKVFRVKHPTRRQSFAPAFKKTRQPRSTQLDLSKLAAFVSVYEIESGMIDDLEALLVRGFANDLLNKKMERFRYARERNNASR